MPRTPPKDTPCQCPPFAILRAEDLAFEILAARKAVKADPMAEGFYRYVEKDIRQKGKDSLFMPQVAEVGSQAFYLKQAALMEERAPLIRREVKKALPSLKVQTKAPPYYRDYGDYYLRRFAKLKTGNAAHPKKISIPGTLWRNHTLKALQESFSILAKKDPALFQTLQYVKQDTLFEYAFRAHPVAYEKSGIHGLTKGDHLTIFLAGNARNELFTKEGFKQFSDILKTHVKKHWGKAVSGFVTTPSHGTHPTANTQLNFIKKYVNPLVEQRNNSKIPADQTHRYLCGVMAAATRNDKRLTIDLEGKRQKKMAETPLHPKWKNVDERRIQNHLSRRR